MKNILLLFSLAILASCASVRPYSANSVPSQPNFAKKSCWAALPSEKDNADRTPDPKLLDMQADAPVDVFFLHPTLYFGNNKAGWNAALEDEALNENVDKSTILFQASAFNGTGKIYAPRYRQAIYRSFFTQDTASARLALDLAYTDIKAAFEFYLQNYNNGRPIIIASHSQGTVHAQRLLKEFFDNKALGRRLVVAYLIGWPIRKDAFQTIPPCETPEQTGCFCSWRSFKYGHTPTDITLGEDIAVTNPLTWKMDGTFADKALNEGMIARKFGPVLPQRADAKAENGILWVHKPKFPGSFFFWKKNYHIADYNLFYMNIRNDAKRREGYFWK
ncbi:MAG: DUF3089 domain-containing protein [Saprospiraceae bacterium]|nr:DUF3089 domain-containing protein [Saprospiraceae bacterium]